MLFDLKQYYNNKKAEQLFGFLEEDHLFFNHLGKVVHRAYKL